MTDTLDKSASLTDSAWKNTFILHDGIELARTLIGRYMNVLIIKSKVLEDAGEFDRIKPIKELFMKLMNALIRLLSKNADFSLYIPTSN